MEPRAQRVCQETETDLRGAEISSSNRNLQFGGLSNGERVERCTLRQQPGAGRLGQARLLGPPFPGSGEESLDPRALFSLGHQ